MKKTQMQTQSGYHIWTRNYPQKEGKAKIDNEHCKHKYLTKVVCTNDKLGQR